MKELIDEIYLNEDLDYKTKKRLLGIFFIETIENEKCTFKNLTDYIKLLMDNLKKQNDEKKLNINIKIGWE